MGVDPQELGVSVSEHGEAIETTAGQLTGIGSEFDMQVKNLTSNLGGLDGKLHSMMDDMRATVPPHPLPSEGGTTQHFYPKSEARIWP